MTICLLIDLAFAFAFSSGFSPRILPPLGRFVSDSGFDAWSLNIDEDEMRRASLVLSIRSMRSVLSLVALDLEICVSIRDGITFTTPRP